MERAACWITCRKAAGLLVGALAIVAFCNVAVADPGVLIVTPSPTVKPGGVLKFQGTINFPLPASYPQVAYGTPMKIGVDSDFYGWVTESQTIQAVGMGSITVNFTKTFTVPANLKSGSVLNFWLSWQYKQEGTTVYTYHLAKTSVKVMALLVPIPKEVEKQGTIQPKPIQKAK
jgi:hypothetical protein